ncbi:DUF305 domain-containing protein [soil metagenome]
MAAAAARLLAVALVAACSTATRESGPPVIQPGAPGEAGRQVTAEELVNGRQPRHTEADVRFMHDMLAHHAQALEMTSLVTARTRSEDIRLLAQRIEASQEDEMALMRRWLEARGEEVPSADAHHGHHGAGGHHRQMPGMLTPEELARLAAATGAEFDRLFLEFMIRHHEGALVMVANLFSSEGAGQDGEIFQFASHVAADQRIEIARMRRMLAAGQ